MTERTELTASTDYNQAIIMVENGLTSEHSKRAYRRALAEFLAWWDGQGRPVLVKATVQAYRAELLSRDLSSSSVNQRMSAIRKLIAEAADNGMIDQQTANGIARVPGVESSGVRSGSWLTKREAQDLINAPDISTLKGLRDRAILAVQVGAGLRRSEVASLTFEHIQQREGRWVIVDLIGKRRHMRTVPIPSWCKVALDEWATAAGISSGHVFRQLDRGGHLAGGKVTAQLVYRVVAEYASKTNLDAAAHDLRRTFAKLAHKGGAGVDQIQLTLGHASLKTTERYLGIEQDLANAPCDKLGLDLSGD